MEKLWWKQPLRVIQTNLQVQDTPKMDPERIAQQTLEMGGNVLVMNVGGIYAWYPTQVPYHRVNEYLPRDFDLLEALIDACHARGIRLVARYDFSKANDHAYQMRPSWFMRDVAGKGVITGATRPGNWDLLYSTCINSGYRNEKVAVPVLLESLARYDIDGVFFNAPHPGDCHCDHCKEKYMGMYGKTLPDDPTLYERDWLSRILRDNVEKWDAAVKSVKPDIPLILYYAISHDNLFDRLATCDMICAEPQDVLSLGWRQIPQSWKPALCIRLGRSEPDIPKPFGIIHSCPGMDWRHTGLPPAEYMYWMSQVPANGGQIWHSITGFADTITDKRILKCVSDINHQIMAVEDEMDGARSCAKVALMWSMEGKGGLEKAFIGQAGNAAEGWAEAMIDRQILFDVLLREQLLSGRLAGYRVLVVPCGNTLDEPLTDALYAFIENGGRVLVEGVMPGTCPQAYAMLGITQDVYRSEPLVASYLRFEGDALRTGFEQTPIIAHRGVVQYVHTDEGTQVLATLVPPFAPPEAVGAPPERASIQNPQTDLPLCLYRPHAQGGCMLMPFEISALVTEYKLDEHARLVENAVNLLLGDAREIACTNVRGLQVMAYQNDHATLVHLVNGVGQRPLAACVPLSDITVRMRWPKALPPHVTCLQSGRALQAVLADGWAQVTVPRLCVWEVLRIADANAEQEETLCSKA